MEVGNSFLAIVGPAGVGKSTSFNAILDHFESRIRVVTKVTTRPPRENEKDTKAGLSLTEFQAGVESGEIILAHQPFGPDGHWYGYSLNELSGQSGQLNIIEPNVEHQLPEFKKIFGASAFVLALRADREYLRHNLSERNSESPEKIEERLSAACSINDFIDKYSNSGLIDQVIELNWHNRSRMLEIVLGLTARVLNKMSVLQGRFC